jgi:hypothetical protein
LKRSRRRARVSAPALAVASLTAARMATVLRPASVWLARASLRVGKGAMSGQSARARRAGIRLWPLGASEYSTRTGTSG